MNKMQLLELFRKLSIWIAIITILFFLVDIFIWDSETFLPHGAVRTILQIGFIASSLATVVTVVKATIAWKKFAFALVLTICTGSLYFFTGSLNDAWKSKKEFLKK